MGRRCKHCGGICPPYLWGRPSHYCSASCARKYAALRKHLRAEGLITNEAPPPPPRRETTRYVAMTTEVGGVIFEVVWHGGIQGHWSTVKGGLLIHD